MNVIVHTLLTNGHVYKEIHFCIKLPLILSYPTQLIIQWMTQK